MSSFSSLINSLQTGSDAPQTAPPVSARVGNTQRPASDGIGSTVGIKRKAETTASAPSAKAVKLTPPTKDTRPAQKEQKPSATATVSRAPGNAAQPYRGTMKPVGASTIKKDTKSASARPATVIPPAPAAAAPAKRGFAALMAKASAAQETVKATGTNTIKHKPTEIMKKKDRMKLMQEAKEQHKARKDRPVRPMDAKRPTEAKILAAGKTPRRKPELAYTGTMRGKSETGTAPKSAKSKGMGQDKYGSYASWSDLSGAEDEEGYYDSESDMEEAGFDDVMEEELQATRIARQEDRRELAEEERLKREKLERKKRLMALGSNAAAVKKRF